MSGNYHPLHPDDDDDGLLNDFRHHPYEAFDPNSPPRPPRSSRRPSGSSRHPESSGQLRPSGSSGHHRRAAQVFPPTAGQDQQGSYGPPQGYPARQTVALARTSQLGPSTWSLYLHRVDPQTSAPRAIMIQPGLSVSVDHDIDDGYSAATLRRDMPNGAADSISLRVRDQFRLTYGNPFNIQLSTSATAVLQATRHGQPVSVDASVRNQRTGFRNPVFRWRNSGSGGYGSFRRKPPPGSNVVVNDPRNLSRQDIPFETYFLAEEATAELKRRMTETGLNIRIDLPHFTADRGYEVSLERNGGVHFQALASLEGREAESRRFTPCPVTVQRWLTLELSDAVDG